MRAISREAGRATRTKARCALRLARIKEKFSTPEIAHTHALTHARRLTQWSNVAAKPVCSFYDGNRTYTASARARSNCSGVRRCCANLQIFRRCNHRPVTMQSCKYSALLSRGISMQTCGYLCIVRASASHMYLLANGSIVLHRFLLGDDEDVRALPATFAISLRDSERW